MSTPEHKIVIVGAGAAGKTAWVAHLMGREFTPKYIPTMGVAVNPIIFGGHQFNVWDCAGQEKFSGLSDGYYINADAAFLFVDDAGEWRRFERELKRFTFPIFYIRNKSDVEKKSQPRFMPSDYVEISVKNGVNCEEPLRAFLKTTGVASDGDNNE